MNKIITAINHPVRRQILNWLRDRSNFPPALPEHADLKGVCGVYIQEKTNLPQPTISRYMGMLLDAGLVKSERHGKWTFYRRDEDNIQAFLSAVASEISKL